MANYFQNSRPNDQALAGLRNATHAPNPADPDRMEWDPSQGGWVVSALSPEDYDQKYPPKPFFKTFGTAAATMPGEPSYAGGPLTGLTPGARR